MVNQGPGSATDVALTVTLDEDITLLSAEAQPGTCLAAPPVVTCDLGSSSPQELSRVTVTTSTDATGLVESTASLTATSVDTDLGNNTLDLSVEVGAITEPCDLWGTADRDRIVGGETSEVICARAGDDHVRGAGGDDRIKGGGGSDIVVAGGGRDVVTGSGGDDRLRGGSGRDRLLGQRGEDVLKGGGGRDRLDGGAGSDRCRGGRRDVTRNCEP